MKAESPNGPITSFQYQAPSGLICSEVVNDQATCTFNLTEDQMNVEDYSFCYDAVDVLGLVSSRRCLRKGILLRVKQFKALAQLASTMKFVQLFIER